MSDWHSPVAIAPITFVSLAWVIRIDGADPHFEVRWRNDEGLQIERWETLTLAAGDVDALAEGGYLGPERAHRYGR